MRQRLRHQETFMSTTVLAVAFDNVVVAYTKAKGASRDWRIALGSRYETTSGRSLAIASTGEAPLRATLSFAPQPLFPQIRGWVGCTKSTLGTIRPKIAATHQRIFSAPPLYRDTLQGPVLNSISDGGSTPPRNPAPHLAPL